MDREGFDYFEYEKENKDKWVAWLAYLPIILVLCWKLVLLTESTPKYISTTDSKEMLLSIIKISYIICHFLAAAVFSFRVTKLDEFSRKKKIIWICALLVLPFIVCPAFYSEYISQKKVCFTEKDAEIEKKKLLIWALIPAMVILLIVLTFIMTVDAMRIHASDAETIADACAYLWQILPFSRFVSAIKYIILVSKNQNMDNGKKFLWGLVLFRFGEVTCPIYWFNYINKKGVNHE